MLYIAHELGHFLEHGTHKEKMILCCLVVQINYCGSNESNAILKLMRNYNFKPSTIINDETILKRISRFIIGIMQKVK